jgi:hypothetical protein
LNRLYGLTFFSAIVTGCSAPEALTNACVPFVSCSAIETIEPPLSCATCAACEDRWGACSPGGSACKRGRLDLDPNTLGCEAALSDAQGQSVMHSIGYPVSYFVLNRGVFPSAIEVPLLVYAQDDASCVPTFTQSCTYTIQAMQLEIPDFSVPESSWSGGVATLNGPITAMDNGTGVGVYAPMLFAFDVQDGSKRRTALSQGWANVGIQHEDAEVYPEQDPPRAAITIDVAAIDFGGYQITNLFFNGTLEAAN